LAELWLLVACAQAEHDSPAEAMGHTPGARGEAPEATRYYGQMTEAQKAEIRHDAIVAITDDARQALRVIEPEEESKRIERLMADADERTREVLERYRGLHPVTFGHCGFLGLCVRGTTRAICIGCPFLVRRPEYLDRVEFVLDGYMQAADAHERMGDLAGARERRRRRRSKSCGLPDGTPVATRCLAAPAASAIAVKELPAATVAYTTTSLRASFYPGVLAAYARSVGGSRPAAIRWRTTRASSTSSSRRPSSAQRQVLTTRAPK
jgi:hypothetical protein